VAQGVGPEVKPQYAKNKQILFKILIRDIVLSYLLLCQTLFCNFSLVSSIIITTL
jgi:hypothetical protein